MFHHPTLREWLVKRNLNETSKFMCDERQGKEKITIFLAMEYQVKVFHVLAKYYLIQGRLKARKDLPTAFQDLIVEARIRRL